VGTVGNHLFFFCALFEEASFEIGSTLRRSEMGTSSGCSSLKLILFARNFDFFHCSRFTSVAFICISVGSQSLYFDASGLVAYDCSWKILIHSFDSKSLICVPDLLDVLDECCFIGCGTSEMSFAADSLLKRNDQGAFLESCLVWVLVDARLKFLAIRVSWISSG
jgi:hypothetical protein